MSALTALTLILGLLVTARCVDARRPQGRFEIAAEGLDTNPQIAVRLGLAPPWRVVVRGEGRLDGAPLPAGAYEVRWNGSALTIDGAEHHRETSASFTLESTQPVSINGHRYRGEFVFRRWSVVNRIALDDYLRGVVGCEIGVTAEFEAMKAQAVVARTYTLGHRAAEITDDTRFQVYRGLDGENDGVNRAVDETSGQVIVWQGLLAREVCYHSTCGGHTESNENVFLTPPVAYLRGVACTLPNGDVPAPTATGEPPDEGDPEAANTPSSPPDATNGDETSALGSGDDAAVRACKQSQWSRWQASWPASRDISVLKTSPNGRVLQVRVGDAVVSGDEIRRAMRFTDAAGRTRSLYSTAFTLHREGDRIVAEGSGWGHGLGLCQWGARGMAQAGVAYTTILAHYFPSTEITQRVAHGAP